MPTWWQVDSIRASRLASQAWELGKQGPKLVNALLLPTGNFLFSNQGKVK